MGVLSDIQEEFDYEIVQLEYKAKVYQGQCGDCGSDNCFSSRLYTPDFYFPRTGIFVETKGKFDALSRTKMSQVCQQSDKDIRIVFMRDNWLTRKRSMTYSRWCELNGIQCAIGDIPLEWCE